MEASVDGALAYNLKKKRNLRFLKFFFYFPILLFLIALTATQSGQIIYKYFQYLTYISSRYQSQGSSVIPSISICPDIDEMVKKI